MIVGVWFCWGILNNMLIIIMNHKGVCVYIYICILSVKKGMNRPFIVVVAG